MLQLPLKALTLAKNFSPPILQQTQQIVFNTGARSRAFCFGSQVESATIDCSLERSCKQKDHVNASQFESPSKEFDFFKENYNNLRVLFKIV